MLVNIAVYRVKGITQNSSSEKFPVWVEIYIDRFSCFTY